MKIDRFGGYERKEDDRIKGYGTSTWYDIAARPKIRTALNGSDRQEIRPGGTD